MTLNPADAPSRLCPAFFPHLKLGIGALAAIVLACTGGPAHSAAYTFQTLNNAGDPNFNQLLGINNAGTIAGYFGDGVAVFNNGYTLVPPATYTPENFPGAVQTQVVGINNTGTTVGFYVDGTGANHGFDQMDALPAATVDNPLTTSTPAFNQLAGVNDANLAAGFYMDSAGNFHGYIATLGSTSTFTPINVTGATSVSATGINNADLVSGFFVDSATGDTLGFLENENGSGLITFEVPGSTMTMFLGLNNKDQAVGNYVDMNGETQGLLYNILNGTFQTISDPNASPMAAFMVNGTTVNGINDAGDLVGFYSDGTHVNGFLAVPAPEPSTLGLIMLPSMLALGLGWIKHRRVISAQGKAA